MPYEYLGHTADLKAAVSGRDLASLYDAAAEMLRDVLVGDSPVRRRTTRELETNAHSPDERFFRFLRELVYLFDSERFLPVAVELRDEGATAVVVHGEPFDPDRHHSERQIKALTRHDFQFESGPGGYRTVLLFDL